VRTPRDTPEITLGLGWRPSLYNRYEEVHRFVEILRNAL